MLIFGNFIFYVNCNLKLENMVEVYYLFVSEGSKVNDFWFVFESFLLNKMIFEDKMSCRSLVFLL